MFLLAFPERVRLSIAQPLSLLGSEAKGVEDFAQTKSVPSQPSLGFEHVPVVLRFHTFPWAAGWMILRLPGKHLPITGEPFYKRCSFPRTAAARCAVLFEIPASCPESQDTRDVWNTAQRAVAIGGRWEARTPARWPHGLAPHTKDRPAEGRRQEGKKWES